MDGSGLEMFLLNYGPNTVRHMLSEKGFIRTLCGRLSADVETECISDTDVSELRDAFEALQTAE